MATAYSGEVSVGTYNRIRIKCDYSGTSATCTVQFRRTQAYSGYWGDSRATLTFNGTTKNAGYSYSGTAGTNWINLVTVSGYSVSTSGGTYNWSFNNPGGGVLGCSGSIYIGSQGSAPSELAISLVEATWNSVTMETTVGDWGTGTSYKRAAYLLEVPYVAGVDKYVEESTSTANPILMNVGTHSRFEFSNNPFVVYGCKEYHTGLFAYTTAGEARLQGPTFYTAPYKLDSLTYTSETFDGSTITATIAAKTNSTWNLSGATVGFLYQVSTDGGETFDGWKDLSTTATVGTTANLSIPNLQPGTAYVVEVAQICMDADIKYSSESSFVNFTTKKYRKTYGPGASGYVTSTFTDDAKHTVENTADHTLLGYSLLGKTEQTRTTGKNIFKVPTNSGYTILSDNSFTATINRTASSSTTYFYSMNFTLDANTQYTLSFDADVDGPGFAAAGGVRLNREGTWTDTWASNGKMTFTTGNTGATTFGFYMCWGESVKTGVEIITWKNIQLEKASSASAFEPYSNGIASPSPDWRQPVLTATGAQTITITGDNNEEQTYELNLGKNLLNLPEFENVEFRGLTATCKNGVLTVTGATGGTYYPAILFYPDGSYITTNWWGAAGNKDVSKGFYTDANTDYMLSSIIEGSSMYEVSVVYESSAQYIIDGTGTQYKKINKNERLNCVGVGFRPNTTVDVKIKLQLERGSTSTGWSPYFTPIELNKLNTYQDKIYRNNGKWYVHKETDKLTVVPNDLSRLSTHSGSFVTVDLVKSGIMQNSSAIVTTASENFVGATMTQTWNNQVSNSVSQATNGHYLQFCLPNSAGTTLDAVKTYFTNHPTDVRYVLTTATDTEITYAPLIEQLETLRKLGHTSVDATTFDRNGYGNATVGLEVKTANASSLPVDSTLVTKQFRKLYGAKPAKKNLLDVPLNFTITSSDRYKTVPITLESGKTYTCSVQDITTDSATYFLFLPYSSSGAVGDGFRLTTTNKTATFTVPSDADRINIYSSTSWADSGSHTTTYHGIMIEEGNKATTYQAYSDGGKAGKAKKIKKLYGPVPAQVNLIHVGPLTQIDSTQTSQGMTSTKRRLTCEEVNIQGTAASTWANFGPQYSVSWPAGTYTLCIDRPLPFGVVIQVNTGTASNHIISPGSTKITFTTTATTNTYYFFVSSLTAGTYYNETFKVQLVKGSTPDYDFKLYSDGTNANTTKLIYND